MNGIFKLFALFSGPVTGLIEKAILSGVMYAAGKGYVSASDVTGVAAAVYTIFSGVFSAVTKSEANKIVAINDSTTNGVKVVAATSNSPSVNAPMVGGAG